MAKRPIFITTDTQPYYAEKLIEFQFHSGFADVQKKKSVKSLHEAFLHEFPSSNIIEISSRSEDEIGIKLSAFNLMIERKNENKFSVEAAFQSSKVFENGGPYKDILKKTSREAKKDVRLKNSGRLLYFEYFGRKFELTPNTYFYNWLYINALSMHQELTEKLKSYDAFTDIEFNPDKSINCQARAVALYVSLEKRGLLWKALQTKETFLEVVYGKTDDSINFVKQMSFWD